MIGDFHLAFAVIAFVMLAVMALRFAKREPTPPGLSFWRQVGYAFGFTGPASSLRPLWKTVLYRICGFAILVASPSSTRGRSSGGARCSPSR